MWLVGEWAVLVSSSSSLVRGTPCARTVRSQSTRSAQSRICLAHVHTHTAVYFCWWCFYRINISHKRNTARFLNGILILNSADKPSKQRLHPCSSNFGGFFFPFSFFPGPVQKEACVTGARIRVTFWINLLKINHLEHHPSERGFIPCASAGEMDLITH